MGRWKGVRGEEHKLSADSVNGPLKVVRGIRVAEPREGKGELRTSFDYRENNCAEISGHFH